MQIFNIFLLSINLYAQPDLKYEKIFINELEYFITDVNSNYSIATTKKWLSWDDKYENLSKIHKNIMYQLTPEIRKKSSELLGIYPAIKAKYQLHKACIYLDDLKVRILSGYNKLLK